MLDIESEETARLFQRPLAPSEGMRVGGVNSGKPCGKGACSRLRDSQTKCFPAARWATEVKDTTSDPFRMAGVYLAARLGISQDWRFERCWIAVPRL